MLQNSSLLIFLFGQNELSFARSDVFRCKMIRKIRLCLYLFVFLFGQSLYANWLNCTDQLKNGTLAQVPFDDDDFVALGEGLVEIQVTPFTQCQSFALNQGKLSYFRNQEHCPSSFIQVSRNVGICPNHPRERISWEEAQENAKLLNRIQYQYTYRLPTLTEWQFAARRGKDLMGKDLINLYQPLKDFAWFAEERGRTHEVGTKKPNPLGLYDVLGNLQQWLQDVYCPLGKQGNPDRRFVVGCISQVGEARCRVNLVTSAHYEVRSEVLGLRWVRERRMLGPDRPSTQLPRDTKPILIQHIVSNPAELVRSSSVTAVEFENIRKLVRAYEASYITKHNLEISPDPTIEAIRVSDIIEFF
jgi:hypothetical protein